MCVHLAAPGSPVAIPAFWETAGRMGPDGGYPTVDCDPLVGVACDADSSADRFSSCACC